MVPDGATCYFCLEERAADEGGKPLVRDCSCRGDNAGFAHLSCITKYAEQKSKLAATKMDLPAFSRSWRECPNCKQPYQNQISLDLSSNFVSFAEANYDNPGKCIIGSQLTNDKVYLMDALRFRAITLLSHAVLHEQSGVEVECIMLLEKILSMVDQMKKDLDMSRWMLMPKHTYEYRFYVLVCGKYQADGCHYLGRILYRTSKDDAYKKYFQKARIIYNLTGLQGPVSRH